MIRTPARYRLLAMFVLPALVVYVAFAVYPLLSSVVLSFFESTGRTSAFVGVANYVDLFTNPTTSARFWNALVCPLDSKKLRTTELSSG